MITGWLQNVKVQHINNEILYYETDYLLYSVNLEMKTQIFMKNKRIAEQNIYCLE